MEDNSYDSEKGLESLLNGEDNTNQNNTLANNMSELSELNPPSTINNITLTLQMGTLINNINMLNDNKIPYPNYDEIPLIKIKNENYFEDGQDIDNYIKSIIKFDDNKFNICNQCKKEKNRYFCKECNKNFCYKCSGICWSEKHTLIIYNYLKKLKKIKIKLN